MCGIAGFIGKRTIEDRRLQHCLSLMQRRGPDARGVYEHSNEAGKNVYLLHSRLSIIDLDERANQPFKLGNKVLVYNGELYNYIELKAELAVQGRQFSTNSDTEVLLRSLHDSGWEVLDRCEGMWAFAMYDEKDGSILLSRDRFGEKPLYYLQDETGIYFASEIKFLFALRGGPIAPNFNHLYRYLVNGYKALYKGEETFFEGVKEVPAGSIIRIDGSGQYQIKKYWIPKFEIDSSMSYEHAVEGARDALIESVKLRLRADVPLAFCMSGGVDSNSLISIAKNVFNYDVHGFTITNTDARYEEQELVDYAVNELEIRHTSIPVNTSGFLAKLKKLVQQHDAPVYTITYYAHWLLMESIKEHGYRISVSGTAADELFTGYYDHHLAYLHAVRNEGDIYQKSVDNWTKHIKPIVRNPLLQDPSVFIENPGMREHIYMNAEGFEGYLQNSWHEEFAEEIYSDDLLRNRMANELFHEATPVILHEDDLNAMYYSVENRSPFLDRKLFEFCNSIPSRHLIQDGKAKSVLRDAMQGIVPDRIIDNRRKVGFNAPIYDFLDIKDPEVKAYMLDNSPIYEHIRRDKVEQLLGKSDLPNSESKFLFYFLNAKIFCEQYAA